MKLAPRQSECFIRARTTPVNTSQVLEEKIYAASCSASLHRRSSSQPSCPPSSSSPFRLVLHVPSSPCRPQPTPWLSLPYLTLPFLHLHAYSSLIAPTLSLPCSTSPSCPTPTPYPATAAHSSPCLALPAPFSSPAAPCPFLPLPPPQGSTLWPRRVILFMEYQHRPEEAHIYSWVFFPGVMRRHRERPSFPPPGPRGCGARRAAPGYF